MVIEDLLLDIEAGGDKEAVEALLAMAHMLVSGQLDNASIPVNESVLEHSSHILEQQLVSDGVDNEDSSSSSVASSVSTHDDPKCSMYKTSRMQMIHTPYSVSPAKLPGLKNFIETKFI